MAWHAPSIAKRKSEGVNSKTAGDGNRNKRSVWTVVLKPYPGAHFATFPPDLVKPCILAGSRPGDIVLDPFNGSGTTGEVAREHGRRYVGIELKAEYLELSRRRFDQHLLFGAA